MAEKAPKITNSEYEVLAILWELGPLTVREVHNELIKAKSIGYTTTLKTIQLMFGRKLLSRKEKGLTHLYTPTLLEEDIQKKNVGQFYR